MLNGSWREARAQFITALIRGNAHTKLKAAGGLMCSLASEGCGVASQGDGQGAPTLRAPSSAEEQDWKKRVPA